MPDSSEPRKYNLDESIRMQECFEWAATYAIRHNLWIGPNARGYYDNPNEQTSPAEKLMIIEKIALITFQAGQSAFKLSLKREGGVIYDNGY